MTEKTVAQKARVKPGASVATVNPAPGIVESLGFGPDTPFVAADEADHVLVFVNSRAELDELVPPAVKSLKPGASIWVFFRKGSKAAGHDMNRDDVWALAEPMGLRPLGILGVDDVWAAFRLRPSA